MGVAFPDQGGKLVGHHPGLPFIAVAAGHLHDNRRQPVGVARTEGTACILLRKRLGFLLVEFEIVRPSAPGGGKDDPLLGGFVLADDIHNTKQLSHMDPGSQH